MIIFPAIDLYEGCAVRLLKGDYTKMTVYSAHPTSVARDFKAAGAEYAHIVDLDGARDGGTPNYDVIRDIINESGLITQVGGGVRAPETVEKYLSAGARRVILGTAALKNPRFLESMAREYGDKIAVGADIKDGMLAVHGWTELSRVSLADFMERLKDIGVKTAIVTDISRDGAMRGTNIELYGELSRAYTVDIIASGGVSSMDDIVKLKALNLYGAIIGKAYYTGAIDLKKAVDLAK